MDTQNNFCYFHKNPVEKITLYASVSYPCNGYYIYGTTEIHACTYETAQSFH